MMTRALLLLCLLLVPLPAHAALVLADRVAETSTTAGAGAITLAGATANHVSFNAAVGVDNTTYYAIVARAPVTQWEVGLGTLTGATTLTRTTPYSTWDGTTLCTTGCAALSFSAGTKDVFVTSPARAVILQDLATTSTPTFGGLTLDGTLAMGANAITFTDAAVIRDAANILAQRNSTSAQALRIYNAFTDASNYERGFMAWVSNEWKIGTEKGGTGTARRLALMYGDASAASYGVVVPAARSSAIELSFVDQTVATTAGRVSIAGSGWRTTATSGIARSLVIGETFRPSATSTMVAIPLQIAPVINYENATPGAGSYEALKINVTETALPTGTNYLVRASAGAAGTTDKFTVTNAGLVVAASTMDATGYKTSGTAGLASQTLTVCKGVTCAGGDQCTVTITGGLVTASTC